MSKTLIAVLVVGVVLLVASPAQARPVRQRAANAALCYEVIATTREHSDVEFAPGQLGKCRAILNSHAAWIQGMYPLQWETDFFSDAESETMFYDLAGRLERAYRVTSTQINAALIRLRSK